MPRISVGQAELAARPHALYRFYDASDVLLYVGITADLPTRISTHRKEKPWWTRVAHISVEQFETRTEALNAEATAIREEKPLYNVAGNTFVPVEQGDELQVVLDAVDRLVYFAAGEDSGRHQEYIADAKATLADIAAHHDEDEEVGDTHPLLWAAENAVTDAAFRERHLTGALFELFRMQPQDLLERVFTKAEESMSRWPGIGPESFRTLRAQAHFLAVEMAEAALSALDPSVTSEWRVAAARALGAKGNEETITLQAAEMYQKACAGMTCTGMCAGPGVRAERCARRATRFVWLRNCRLCEDTCIGHLAFCERHYGPAVDGVLQRPDGEFYEVAHSRFVDTEHDPAPVKTIAARVAAELSVAHEEVPS